MTDGHDRVPQQHPRTGVAHDAPDARPHFRLVAVNGTPGTGGLAIAEEAFGEPLLGVVIQIATVRARVLSLVVAAAVEPYHDADGAGFAL
jgi:hypothetical protein